VKGHANAAFTVRCLQSVLRPGLCVIFLDVHTYVEPRHAEYLNPASRPRLQKLAKAAQLDPILQAHIHLGWVLLFKRRRDARRIEVLQANSRSIRYSAPASHSNFPRPCLTCASSATPTPCRCCTKLRHARLICGPSRCGWPLPTYSWGNLPMRWRRPRKSCRSSPLFTITVHRRIRGCGASLRRAGQGGGYRNVET